MRLLCLLLLTFFAAPAAASPICVAGRLAETGSGKAIDFAEIYLFTGGNGRRVRRCRTSRAVSGWIPSIRALIR